ncbi:MAG: hypothetical protein EXS16_06850 [Gemmataceae bacterium]|nr:hypothetical protein [Gemmataceae bacterium]
MFRLCVVVAISSAAVGGCSSDGAGQHEVSGEVFFQGKPLDQGTIQFEPDDMEQCSNGGAVIVNGKYSIAKQRGLKPGVYTVRVSSGDATDMGPPKEAPGQARPVARDRIPETWNVNSKNKIEINAGKNVFEHRIS